MSVTNLQTSEGGHSIHDAQKRLAPSLVSRAYEQSDGTNEDAASILFRMASSDPDFLRDNLPAILEEWCSHEVRMFVGSRRLKSWTPPNMDMKQNSDRLIAAVEDNLLNFPLPGGRRLGDANAAECRAGAEFYRIRANDMAWKARWLEQVAEKTGRKKCVQNALSEAELRELQEATNAN